MRVAFLADIHGNLPALEAVIGDLHLQSPDAVYLVGDQVNRCPWSNEVLDLIADKRWTGIRGNHEVVLSHLAKAHEPTRFDNRERFPDLWWTLERLEAHHRQAIDDLPEELPLDFGVGAPLRIVHGVPNDPFRGLFVDTETAEAAKLLEVVPESVVVCGHTHRPLLRTIGRWRVLNGGSVGLSYNSDPRAQYLLLTADGDDWTPIFRRVEYSVQSVRDAFNRRELLQRYGPLVRIHLRTIETAQPWTSDFGHWLNVRRPDLQNNLEEAVDTYERTHGPGRWSFVEA